MSAFDRKTPSSRAFRAVEGGLSTLSVFPPRGLGAFPRPRTPPVG